MTDHSFCPIIDLWPSAAALAVDLDEKDITVRKWRSRDSIPGDRWLRLVDAAERRGFRDVTLDRLARIADIRARGRGAPTAQRPEAA